MSQERRQTILATVAVVILFGAYEVAKTLLFPGLETSTSHVISTIVVGALTCIAARFVFYKQYALLKERELANQRLREALAQAERSESLLRAIVESVAEGLVITDRETNLLLVNDAARTLLNLSERPLTRLAELSRDPQIHRTFAQALSTGARAEARVETREASSQQRRVLRLHAAPLRLHSGQLDGVVGAPHGFSGFERCGGLT